MAVVLRWSWEIYVGTTFNISTQSFLLTSKNSSNAALSEQSCFPSYCKQKRVMSQLQNFKVVRGKGLAVMERFSIALGEVCHNSHEWLTEGTVGPQLTCFFWTLFVLITAVSPKLHVLQIKYGKTHFLHSRHSGKHNVGYE